jgi:hypothetical protein
VQYHYDSKGRLLDGPDDPVCPHGNDIMSPCRPCVVEANTIREPRGVNPWPDLSDLEDLPY